MIGNGDIRAPEDALDMMRRTGCDGVMIGRASMKNPWIFHQIRSLLRGEPMVKPTPNQRRDLILRHFEMLRDSEEEKTAFHKIRTFTGWYTHGIPGGRDLRRRINGMKTVDEFLAAIEDAFTAAWAA